MADKSILFDKFFPVLLVVLAVVMLALIMFAFGVLTGLIPWA